MPVSLSIKNVPDNVAERLRERAKRNHRSLQGELLAILEEATPKETLSNSVEIIREEHDTDHGRLSGKVTVNELYEHGKRRGLRTASDSVEILRELRDGRNRG